MKEGYSGYLQGIPTYTSLYNEKEVIAILTNWWNTNFDGLASAEENTLFAIIVKEKYNAISLFESNYGNYFCAAIFFIPIVANLSCAFAFRNFNHLLIIKIITLMS